MTYAEKLLDPRWQKRRLEIMQAARFECSSCGAADKTLHVHHKFYLKGFEPWDYDDDQLECLCVDCHAMEGKRMAKLAELLSLASGTDIETIIGYLAASLEIIENIDLKGLDFGYHFLDGVSAYLLTRTEEDIFEVGRITGVIEK